MTRKLAPSCDWVGGKAAWPGSRFLNLGDVTSWGQKILSPVHRRVFKSFFGTCPLGDSSVPQFWPPGTPAQAKCVRGAPLPHPAADIQASRGKPQRQEQKREVAGASYGRCLKDSASIGCVAASDVLLSFHSYMKQLASFLLLFVLFSFPFFLLKYLSWVPVIGKQSTPGWCAHRL